MNKGNNQPVRNAKDFSSLLAGSEPDPRIKPLVWEALGEDNFRVKCPLFGNIRVENYSVGFLVSWSVPGFCDVFIDGYFPDADQALRAAEQEYQRRMIEFLV